jgi:hypothetical protein
MEEFSITSNDNQIVITIDRSLMDMDSINHLIERLRVEQLIKKANFTEDVLDIADEIKEDWWKKNKKEYLKCKITY